MGKSGHIGSKIAATLASTGSPSFFVHSGEASHGDLGMITGSDVLLAISNSGETINPTGFDPAVLSRDFPVMIVLTIALFAMAYGTGEKGRITRVEGFALLLVFVGYQLFILSQLF